MFIDNELYIKTSRNEEIVPSNTFPSGVWENNWNKLWSNKHRALCKKQWSGVLCRSRGATGRGAWANNAFNYFWLNDTFPIASLTKRARFSTVIVISTRNVTIFKWQNNWIVSTCKRRLWTTSAWKKQSFSVVVFVAWIIHYYFCNVFMDSMYSMFCNCFHSSR